MKISFSLWSSTVILIAISSIFLITRLYLINTQPPSLYWDEASIGYNAFSILKTGRDEWGQLLPIHFRAFNEYKLPVYIYCLTLIEAIFGNNIFAVRLPAVLFSFGSLIILFLLCERLFKRRSISLMSCFLFTIEPWFFIFSRTAYEATAGLFFFLLGCYFLLRYKDSGWFLVSAAGSFVGAMYSYNAFRILAPLFLIYYSLSLIIFNQMFVLVKREWRKILAAIFVFLIGIIPMVNLYRFDGGLKRYSDTSVVTGAGFEQGATIIFYNTLKHFTPDFLFLSGDQNIRSHTGNVGEIYWLQFLFLILGIIYIVKQRNFGSIILIGLLFISPIPSAVTRESPHALRSILLLVPLTILSAIGVVYMNDLIRWKQFGYGIVLAFFCLLFSVYFGKYINYYQTVVSDAWQYGYAEAFRTYGDDFKNYDSVIVSDRYSQPYIFYLEYLNIDPDYYRKERILNIQPRVETSLVKQIGNVYFGEVHFADFPAGRSLVFAHPTERLTEIAAKAVILNPDKSVALYVYDYKKE